MSHLLRSMARRRGDVAARHGGEQLNVVPPSAAGVAYRLAEQPREGVDGLLVARYRSHIAAVIVSIGSACTIRGDGSGSDILVTSDQAPCAAKVNGDNPTATYALGMCPIPARR